MTAAIRLLGEGDAADYRAIRLEALRQDPEAFSSSWEEESVLELSHFAQGTRSAAVFGAYLDGKIVGLARLVPDHGERNQHKAMLGSLYVSPEARGMGTGGMLIDAVLAAARSPIEQVHLGVHASNAAVIRLYEAKGFTRYGVEPRAIKMPDGYIDEMLMVRFLVTGAEGVIQGC